MGSTPKKLKYLFLLSSFLSFFPSPLSLSLSLQVTNTNTASYQHRCMLSPLQNAIASTASLSLAPLSLSLPTYHGHFLESQPTITVTTSTTSISFTLLSLAPLPLLPPPLSPHSHYNQPKTPHHAPASPSLPLLRITCPHV